MKKYLKNMSKNQKIATIALSVVAVAAAVSIIAPLFFLVMFFQRQIVTGLTAGAVKG